MRKMHNGYLVMTKGIKNEIDTTPLFISEVVTALDRYNKDDWGDLSDNDKELNDMAVEHGNDRILAAYNTSKGKIYIITEEDRSVTTVLFADEY